VCAPPPQPSPGVEVPVSLSNVQLPPPHLSSTGTPFSSLTRPPTQHQVSRLRRHLSEVSTPARAVAPESPRRLDLERGEGREGGGEGRPGTGGRRGRRQDGRGRERLDSLVRNDLGGVCVQSATKAHEGEGLMRGAGHSCTCLPRAHAGRQVHWQRIGWEGARDAGCWYPPLPQGRGCAARDETRALQLPPRATRSPLPSGRTGDGGAKPVGCWHARGRFASSVASRLGPAAPPLHPAPVCCATRRCGARARDF
jgi:hypothetical protein